MAQFSNIPERAGILERIPDYEVIIEPLGKTATVRFQGTVVACSNDALLVKETRHDDVVYFPRSALEESFFIPTDHSTYCPFKGHANYWAIEVDNEKAENVVWSYEAPYPEVSGIKDHVAFYADRTELSIG